MYVQVSDNRQRKEDSSFMIFPVFFKVINETTSSFKTFLISNVCNNGPKL